jgi:hypothetical protein
VKAVPRVTQRLKTLRVSSLSVGILEQTPMSIQIQPQHLALATTLIQLLYASKIGHLLSLTTNIFIGSLM